MEAVKRILIADAGEEHRQNLIHVLSGDPDFVVAGQTGDGLVDGPAGSLLRDDTVAGAAVEGRTGADLAVDGFIDDRTLVIAIQTHTLLLVFFFSVVAAV